MPAARINMRKIKDVLRLKLHAGLSHERIAAALNISKGVVAKYASLAAAAGLDLVFGFNIEDGENFFLTVKDGACEMSQGESANANVTLIMSTETLAGITTGETDGMQAFMGGKLRAEGDMMLAMKLGELFPV